MHQDRRACNKLLSIIHEQQVHRARDALRVIK